MEISTDIINGVGLGIEYISASDDIEYPCLIVDLLVLRFVVEFTGS